MAYMSKEDFLDLFYIAAMGQDKAFIKAVEMVVDDTPDADVEEIKHGHWIWITEDKYKCSECGAETRVDEWMEMPLYECCPYCFTRMDGKVER